MSSGDAHLYGIPKPKQTPKELSSTTSLAFKSTLSSLLSTSNSSTKTSGRPRPSKNKSDIFSGHNKGSKKRALADLQDEEDRGRQMGRTGALGEIDEDVLHRSKRKLEMKAKIYNRTKKGDLEGEKVGGGEESLIDFDRKWVERGGKDEDTSEDDEVDNAGNEMIEYQDEYGRTKTGTRNEAERMERRKRNQLLGAEELDRMSARPAMPTSNLIYGDTIQSMAFNPDDDVLNKMNEIAKKRDRSLTPPEMRHYEADKEIRSKGVGFYSFSKDEKVRGDEMEALERERLETERVRREREEKKESRKREIEERRRAIGEKRAKKQADSFLDGLSASLEAGETKEEDG